MSDEVATWNEPSLPRTLGLGFTTSSPEPAQTDFEKPIRRTSTRSRHSRAFSMLDQYKELDCSSTGVHNVDAAPQNTVAEATCLEPSTPALPSTEYDDDALDMLISAVEEDVVPKENELPAEAAPIHTVSPKGPAEPGHASSATPTLSMERSVMPTKGNRVQKEPTQQAKASGTPVQARLWPELSHNLPPVEQEGAPLTHGDVRRIYAEILAEQEALRRAKKPIGKVWRRMRTLLDASSAPSQPLSKARVQAEPYPTTRKTEIKPDYYSVADKEMLRMALYSSHTQVLDCMAPMPVARASNNENAPPCHPSAPVVRSLRTARRLEPSACQRSHTSSLRERHDLPKNMQMTTQGLR